MNLRNHTMRDLLSKLDKLSGPKTVDESSPKGWEGTVKAMKKHKEIDNPWALAHYMKNKGYKSHKKVKEQFLRKRIRQLMYDHKLFESADKCNELAQLTKELKTIHAEQHQRILESKLNSKQEVINYFVSKGKTAAQGAMAWERGWRGPTPKIKKPAPQNPNVKYWWQDKDESIGENDTPYDPDRWLTPAQREWRKNKVSLDMKYYDKNSIWAENTRDGILIHGDANGGFADQDGGEGHGSFEFVANLNTGEILELKYDDSGENGYYGDDDAMKEIIEEILSDVKATYGDHWNSKYDPEEGGIGID